MHQTLPINFPFIFEKVNKSLKNHQSFAKKVLLLFKLKYNPLWNGCEVTVKNSIHKHAVAHCTMTKTANFVAFFVLRNLKITLYTIEAHFQVENSEKLAYIKKLLQLRPI